MTRDEKLYFEAVTLMLKITYMIKKEYNEAKEMRLQRLERLAIRRIQRRMKVLDAYDD